MSSGWCKRGVAGEIPRKKLRRFAFALILFCCFFVPLVSAQDQPLTSPHEPELRLCSQNLFNYGAEERKKKRKKGAREKQRDFLVARFLAADCDVIAVQEVIGETEREAKTILGSLADSLSARSERKFVPYVTSGRSDRIRNGFLIAESKVRVLEVEALRYEHLPKMSLLGPGERFDRPPLILTLQVPGRGSAEPRTFVVASFHFKSKAKSFQDPARLSFELVRMQMAEKIREYVSAKAATLGSGATPILLGDTNSEPGSAAGAILTGRLRLSQFTEQSGCRVTELLEPACNEQVPAEASFAGLLATSVREGENRERVHTYRYRGTSSIIDDIFIPTTALSLVRGPAKRIVAGTNGEYFKGSDHLLVWAEVNW